MEGNEKKPITKEAAVKEIDIIISKAHGDRASHDYLKGCIKVICDELKIEYPFKE